MTKQELIDKFAQRCIDDMDTGVLMQYAYDGIVQRLEDLSEADLLNEVESSCYSDLKFSIENYGLD